MREPYRRSAFEYKGRTCIGGAEPFDDSLWKPSAIIDGVKHTDPGSAFFETRETAAIGGERLCERLIDEKGD